MLTPLKPTGFTVIWACFAFKSSQFFLKFIWILWMLERDELWCFMCRYSYSDMFWWYLQRFRLQIVRPTKSSNSNIDRMRTALWPNVNFKSLHEFLQCFCSFDTWLLDCGHLKILQTYYLMINMANISLAFFTL